MPYNVRDNGGLTKLRKYLDKPRTLQQIMLTCGVEKRTAYRWMQYLKEEGHDIVARRKAGAGVARYAIEK